MSLAGMLEQAAGSGALDQIGARVGLDPSTLRSVIDSVAPALTAGLAGSAQAGSLPAATDAEPGSTQAEQHGNAVLGAIFGSKQASRDVAAQASGETGVGVEQIKAVLPHLASLATALGEGQAGLGDLLGHFRAS